MHTHVCVHAIVNVYIKNLKDIEIMPLHIFSSIVWNKEEKILIYKRVKILCHCYQKLAVAVDRPEK